MTQALNVSFSFNLTATKIEGVAVCVSLIKELGPQG